MTPPTQIYSEFGMTELARCSQFLNAKSRNRVLIVRNFLAHGTHTD